MRALQKLIEDKKSTIGVVGVGYVGSALALATSSVGFKTIGFEIDQKKIKQIKNLKKKLLTATNDKSQLKDCNIICICVPTPVYKDKSPDFRYLTKAALEIAKYLCKGQLIIIESSVNPGATRTVVLPLLEKSGLRAGKDFYLSFSPERVDPGNTKYQLADIPKVVGGYDEESKQLTVAFYSYFIRKVVPVSSLETAELTKILENTYRFVNISLINEIADYAKAIGVDIWEVIDAASTKPFGFQSHYPGPGIGGHCIPVDPYYLLQDAQRLGIHLGLVKAAGEVNERQPKKVVRRTLEILRKTNGKKKNHKVLLVGVSYKSDVSDVRESAALKIWELFNKKGVDVSYHDPYVTKINGYSSVDLRDKVINAHDLVVIITDHSSIPYDNLTKYNKPILDTRNVFKKLKSSHLFRI